MAVQSHVVTDHETRRTFEIVVADEKRVIALNERTENTVKEGSRIVGAAYVWNPVAPDSEWWKQWQGEAESGAFETPDDLGESA